MIGEILVRVRQKQSPNCGEPAPVVVWKTFKSRTTNGEKGERRCTELGATQRHGQGRRIGRLLKNRFTSVFGTPRASMQMQRQSERGLKSENEHKIRGSVPSEVAGANPPTKALRA